MYLFILYLLFTDVSLIERLMEMDPYRCNPDDNSLNDRYIVQLVQNYRSHPAILAPSNELFYSRKLIPCAKLGQLIRSQAHNH